MTKMRLGHITTLLLLTANTAASKSIAERGQLGDLTSAYFYYCTPPPQPPVTTWTPLFPEGIFIVDVDITINVYVAVFVNVCPDIGLCHLQYTLTQKCTRTSICQPPPIPLGFTVTEKPCDIYGQPVTITVTEPCNTSSPPDSSQWPPNSKLVPPPALDSGQIPPQLGNTAQLPPNFDNYGQNSPNQANDSNIGTAPNVDNGGQDHPGLANNPHFGVPSNYAESPPSVPLPTHSFNPYLPPMPGMPPASPALPPSLPSKTGSSSGPHHNGAERIAKTEVMVSMMMLALIAAIMCAL